MIKQLLLEKGINGGFRNNNDGSDSLRSRPKRSVNFETGTLEQTSDDSKSIFSENVLTVGPILKYSESTQDQYWGELFWGNFSYLFVGLKFEILMRKLSLS